MYFFYKCEVKVSKLSFPLFGNTKHLLTNDLTRHYVK